MSRECFLSYFLFFVDLPAYVSAPKRQAISYKHIKEGYINEEPIVDFWRHSVAFLAMEENDLDPNHGTNNDEVEDGHQSAKSIDASYAQITGEQEEES